MQRRTTLPTSFSCRRTDTSNRRRLQAFLAAALIATISCIGGAALADDQTVHGRWFVVRDSSEGADPTARRVTAYAKERDSDATIVGDPTVEGATLSVVAAGTNPTTQTFELPAAFWSEKTVRKTQTFSYRDLTGQNGPVARAYIRRSRKGKFEIKATIVGRRNDASDLEIVPPNEGTDGLLVLTLGGGDRYCVQYGPEGKVKNRGAKYFRVINPAKGGGCPATPEPPQDPTWTQVSTIGPTARAEASMAYDSQRNRTVLFGGILPPPTGVVNDTYEWDGSSWSLIAPATSAPGSLSQPMAYDSQRGVSVLYGGGFTAQSDTWEWDGVNWMERATTGPSPRGAFSAAYDSQRGVTVLFGGISNLNGELLGETWEWDGTVWSQRLSANEPQVRGGHGMVYDSQRGVMVMFGGFGGIDPIANIIILYGDTWEWDGTDWTQVAADDGSGPAGREGQGMVYDSLRGRVVMFGGADISNVLADTWAWNGSNWTNLNLSEAPSPREGHSMAYNSKTDSIVVFGGFGAPPGPILIGDTWQLSPP